MIALFRPLSDVAVAHTEDQRRREARRRRKVTILFALLLLSVAGVSQAAERDLPAGVIEFSVAPASSDAMVAGGHDAPRSGSTPLAATAVDASSGGAVPQRRSVDQLSPGRRGRPAYAQLLAIPANFDADAEPDGWRAEVMVRDAGDLALSLGSAYATFELTPRVVLVDGQRAVDATSEPLRWSLPLQFDENGIAAVKLPLRNRWDLMLDWSGARASSGDSLHDLRSIVGAPPCGRLRVRVSIPGEGVFEAVAAVGLREPVLVDTRWPYR